MEWMDRLGFDSDDLSLFSLVISIAFLMSAFSTDGFYRQLFLLIAGAFLSIFITLKIVKIVLERDREEKWKQIKKMTLKRIMLDLAYLYQIAAMTLGDATFLKGSSIPPEIRDKLIQGVSQPEKSVSMAISALAESLGEVDFRSTTYHKEKFGTSKWFEAEKARLNILLFLYAHVTEALDDLQLVLIPRVFLLSSDKELIGSLVVLDGICARLRSNEGIQNKGLGR